MLPLDKLDRYVCLKKSEIVIDDKDEESSDDEDDEDDGEDDEDDEGDDDDDETQRDETESVTVVGDDEEEKEVEVLDTIQEEKVRPRAALDQLRGGIVLNCSAFPVGLAALPGHCVHGRREGRDALPRGRH